VIYAAPDDADEDNSWVSQARPMLDVLPGARLAPIYGKSANRAREFMGVITFQDDEEEEEDGVGGAYVLTHDGGAKGVLGKYRVDKLEPRTLPVLLGFDESENIHDKAVAMRLASHTREVAKGMGWLQKNVRAVLDKVNNPRPRHLLRVWHDCEDDEWHTEVNWWDYVNDKVPADPKLTTVELLSNMPLDKQRVYARAHPREHDWVALDILEPPPAAPDPLKALPKPKTKRRSSTGTGKAKRARIASSPNKSALVARCAAANLNKQGTKQQLKQRLQNHDDDAEEESVGTTEPKYSPGRVAMMRELAQLKETVAQANAANKMQLDAKMMQQPMMMQQPVAAAPQQPMMMQQPVAAAPQQPMMMQQPVAAAPQQPMMMQQPVAAAPQQPMMMQQLVAAAPQQPMMMQQPVAAAPQQPMMMQQPVAAAPQQPMMMQQPAAAAPQQPVMMQQPVAAAPQQPVMMQQPAAAAPQQHVMMQQPAAAAPQQPVMMQQPAAAALQQPMMMQRPAVAALQQPMMMQQPAAAAAQPMMMQRPAWHWQTQ
jgi:hypothetical protein